MKEHFTRHLQQQIIFADQVRMHLMKYVLNWDSQPEKTTEIPLKNTETKIQSIDESVDEQEPDDEGIIDLEEIIEEEMASLTTVVNNMSYSIREIGDNINIRVAEVNALASQGENNLDDKARQRKRAELKRITKKTPPGT